MEYKNPLLKQKSNNRYTTRCVGKVSPYLPYALRCQFAVECVRSLMAPVQIQVMELELMLRDS